MYTLGMADYFAIRDADPDLDAIVVLNKWNHYTEDAERQGRIDRIGVFKSDEFRSALHRQGDDFLGDSGSSGT